MRKFALPLFCLFLFSAPVFATPRITLETPENAPASKPEEEAFRNELSLVARKSLELGSAMISQIKKINDSYRLTAQAVRILADRGDIRNALPLLNDAIQDYDGNRMAYLLRGYAQENLGSPEEAAESYKEFYRNSLTLVPVETRLIGPESLEVFRDYVETRFKAWHVRPPEPKVSLRLHEMRSLTLLEDSKTGEMINLILPLTLITGLIFLGMARAWQIEFHPGVRYFLISFYVWVILGYGLWSAHFFFGLPFWISLETELKLFLGAGAGGIILIYAGRRFLEDRREMKLLGASRCSGCRKVISRMDARCPFCGQPQN